MKLKSHLTAFVTALCLWASMGETAHAQAASSFPYGKRWAGKNYDKNDPWLSAGVVIAHRPSPKTDAIAPQDQVVYGLESRYHINPKLALMVGVHFGGNTKALSSNNRDIWDPYSTPAIDHVYREAYWQAGADFGLIEAKYFHLQAGPRFGLQAASTSFESDASDALEYYEDVDAKGLFTAGVVRAGFFPVPYVEVGVHLQGDYTIGKELAGPGRQIGGYSVVHF